eukprot:1117630-Pyramimonas_sp.AAC.1
MRQYIAFGEAYEKETTLPVSDTMLCGFITWLAAKGLKVMVDTFSPFAANHVMKPHNMVSDTGRVVTY